MRLKSIFKSAFFIKCIFVIFLSLLLFISSISYKHTRSLSESSGFLILSSKIQFQLENVLFMLQEAESGQRGFIITHDTVFLRPYKTAQQKIYIAYLKLKSLSVDNQQNHNLDTLMQLVNLRFELMDYSLKIAAGKTDEMILDGNLRHGEEVMNKIQVFINKMYDLEINNFKERQNKYKNEDSFLPISIFLFMIFSLVVLIYSYFKIMKDLLSLKKFNSELLVIHESMKHSEIIGEFGISIWDLKTKKLQYSDNLFRLLGSEPQSFEPTIENYLKFVHPDDRTTLTVGAEKLFSENKVTRHFYRILRADGGVRYFMSQGEFISDGSSKLHIGVIKDLTELQLSKMELEEKNHELKQSIVELESFNRVASHDLQEPLRKIQTFISLISEKDKIHISDAGKQYLSKIESSANRMRILIDDLLMFSRTNKSQNVFEKTDLNLLLGNALQMLSQNIEEKNAVIHSSQLPALNVIDFQIKQLFVNLLGNALKYCKPGIPPEININCDQLPIDYNPVFITNTFKKYYKISISDNGIGFDQKFSEKIFILFNRLHQIDEYPGSGIGLAICKKIVENHKGFIIAEGKPGIGATFTVFLPA